MSTNTILSSFSLAGRTVCVTGASSGIGHHLALVAAAAGARVLVCARRLDRLNSLVNAIRAQGGDAKAFAVDLTDRTSLEAFIEALEREPGGIDVLVNNAGIAPGSRAIDVTPESAEQTWAINFNAPFRLAQAAARQWIASKRPGVIVNIASIYGQSGSPGVPMYCATKAALTNLTRALACEWAKFGIRVNALAPGFFMTELNMEALEGTIGEGLLKRIPMRRFGDIDDLTGPFLLLASDASRFMTGSVLCVDGGQSSWI